MTVNERVEAPEVRQSFLMGGPYFSKWIEYDLKRISHMVAQIRKPGPDQKFDAQYVFEIFIKRYELLIERYSRGDDLHELRAMLPEIVDTWEWARREELKVFTEDEMANRHGFARNLDAYSLALWMVSIAICLEADNDLLSRMLALIGNEGEDWLFECLVAHRAPGRRATDQLLYRKPYQLLKDAIEDADPTSRNRSMARFLTAWYPSMYKTYWHDCHKGPEGGGYFGYWCFEAAGAVRVCGMDDTTFRDDPYYPKDLAAYRRQ
jgi:hypothetical protein